ncbi:MAG: N-acetylneuraminate synthase family protein [Halobacteriovoraceae bacterium]|nr:N-acetylneuraminate synthase family protein [Halobacteriovoraceae bacterium]
MKERPLIIAEIGCNHKGDMEVAKKMIEIAATSIKADVVKFQKRNNKELLTKNQYYSPHPDPIKSYGKTYGEHREFLEFNLEQHKQLKACCDKFRIEYSVSVWDVTSAEQMITLNPRTIKVPSACNLNKKLLSKLIDDFKGEIHLSIGMTSPKEIEDIVAFFQQERRNKDLILYSCTSGYPVSMEDVCLQEITKLKKKYGDIVKSIAFSGHHFGIAIDIAAMMLGVSHIERHYTLSRAWKGSDHIISLEPADFRKLCQDIKDVFKALIYKKNNLLDVENKYRKRLKKNLIYWS